MRAETRQSIILLAGSGVSAALGIAYTAHVGRRLGPEDYADFAAALSILYFVTFALGPLASTTARFSAQSASVGDLGQVRALLVRTTRTVAVYGLAALAAVIVVAPLLSRSLRFHSTLPLLVAFGVGYLTLLLSVVRGVLRGVQRFAQYSRGLVIEAVVRLFSGVALLAIVATAAMGLAAYVAAVAAALALAWVELRQALRGHRAVAIDWSPVWRFTVPMFVLTITLAGFQNIDMLIVKRALSATEAGAYGAALSVARTLYAVFVPFNTMLLPLLAFAHTQGKPPAGTLLRVCSYFVAVATGPLLAFALAPRVIMVSLYGDQFALAAPLLFPLGLAMCLGYLSFLIAQALAAADKFRFVPVYVLCLLLELGALVLWHGSPTTVAFIVVIAQAGTLLLMVALTIATGIASPAAPTNVQAASEL